MSSPVLIIIDHFRRMSFNDKIIVLPVDFLGILQSKNIIDVLIECLDFNQVTLFIGWQGIVVCIIFDFINEELIIGLGFKKKFGFIFVIQRCIIFWNVTRGNGSSDAKFLAACKCRKSPKACTNINKLMGRNRSSILQTSTCQSGIGIRIIRSIP